jgi:hypothetical protein
MEENKEAMDLVASLEVKNKELDSEIEKLRQESLQSSHKQEDTQLKLQEMIKQSD